MIEFRRYYYALDTNGQRYPLCISNYGTGEDEYTVVRLGLGRPYDLTDYYVVGYPELVGGEDPNTRYNATITKSTEVLRHIPQMELQDLLSRLITDVERNGRLRRMEFSVKSHLCSLCGTLLTDTQYEEYYACPDCNITANKYKPKQFFKLRDAMTKYTKPQQPFNPDDYHKLIAPDASVHTISNIELFARKHNFDVEIVQAFIDGMDVSLGEWRRYGNKRRKNFRVISPHGETINITDVSVFCKVHSLPYNQMLRLVQGKISNYKGWVKC